MPYCGFIRLCAESKGIYLATFARLLAVSADECTFMLTDVAYWSLVLAHFMDLTEDNCSVCLVCVNGLL